MTEGDHFSSLCHSFSQECEFDMTSFIDVVGNNEVTSTRADKLMQDFTTAMALSAQKSEDEARVH